jgi:hypothetical protein
MVSYYGTCGELGINTIGYREYKIESIKLNPFDSSAWGL